MNIKNKYVQLAMGSLPIMILWYVGAFFSDNTFLNPQHSIFTDWHIENYDVPVLVLHCIPIMLFLSAMVYKRYDFKIAYISAVASVVIPVISRNWGYIDDGNILSWIFTFVVVLPLYPFAVAGNAVFYGVDWYLFTTGRGYLDDNLVYLCFFTVIMISILIFTLVKPKKTKVPVGQEYVNDINQQNFFYQ